MTCYIDRVMTCFLQEKRQAQACEGHARGESTRRRPALPALSGLSKVRWHCSARQKTKSGRTVYAAFPWRGDSPASNQGRKPAQPEQLSRIPATTEPARPKPR